MKDERKRLTRTQAKALRDALTGEMVNPRWMNIRTRRELDRRHLLAYRRGDIDTAGTVALVLAAGCEECDMCEEILLEPSQVERGAFCDWAEVLQ